MVSRMSTYGVEISDRVNATTQDPEQRQKTGCASRGPCTVSVTSADKVWAIRGLEVQVPRMDEVEFVGYGKEGRKWTVEGEDR
jgi:hypothetical protein